MTKQYDKAIEAWKRHLEYNPGSIATYYNIANAYAYLLKNNEEAEAYYRQFLDLARQEENPTDYLKQMIQIAERMIKVYDQLKKK